jgi:hypothetical protein
MGCAFLRASLIDMASDQLRMGPARFGGLLESSLITTIKRLLAKERK